MSDATPIAESDVVPISVPVHIAVFNALPIAESDNLPFTKTNALLIA